MIEQVDEKVSTTSSEFRPVQETLGRQCCQLYSEHRSRTPLQSTRASSDKMAPTLKGTVFPDSRPQSPYERIDSQTFEELTTTNQVETGQAFDECSTGVP